MLPVDAAARGPFLGARVLLLLKDLSRATPPHSNLLSQAFGLSRSEARLASVIATGVSAERAAEEREFAILLAPLLKVVAGFSSKQECNSAGETAKGSANLAPGEPFMLGKTGIVVVLVK